MLLFLFSALLSDRNHLRKRPADSFQPWFVTNVAEKFWFDWAVSRQKHLSLLPSNRPSCPQTDPVSLKQTQSPSNRPSRPQTDPVAPFSPVDTRKRVRVMEHVRFTVSGWRQIFDWHRGSEIKRFIYKWFKCADTRTVIRRWRSGGMVQTAESKKRTGEFQVSMQLTDFRMDPSPEFF